MSTARNEEKTTRPLHERQFRILRKIWEHGEEGYVFLPWIPADKASDDDVRRANWNQGRAFRWPDDQDAIKVHLQEHAGDEQYFSAFKFKDADAGPKQDNAKDSALLFADLDSVDPRSLDLVPTIAWETSPGSYQAAWLIDEDSTREGEHNHGGLNHRLTEEVGADRGGWFSNKLLRVPGSTHNKGEPTPGKILWLKGDQRYSWEHLDSTIESLPAKLQIDAPNVRQEILNGVDRRQALKNARMRGFPRKMLQELKSDPVPDKGERSLMMWAVARELAKAGCVLVEIMALLQHSRWNKHDGQPQELVRLLAISSKVITDLTPEEQERADREIRVDLPDTDRARVREFMRRAVRPPGFLVKGVLPDTGCGFIAGPPKNFKSWLGLDAAVSISSGQKLLDMPTKSGVVVLIQAEDPIHRIQQRLDMVYAGKPNASKQARGHMEITDDRQLRWTPQGSTPGELYVYYRPDFKLGDDQWMVWLEDLIEKTGADLVIIDNLIKVLPHGVDIDKVNIKEPLEELKTMMDEYHCVLGIIHHSPKASEANVGLLGSVALHAWADWGIYFKSKKTENGRTTARFYVENKDAIEDTITIDVSSLNGGPRELMEYEGEVGYVQDQPGIWAPRVLVPSDDEESTPGKGKQKESASDRDRRRVIEWVQSQEPGKIFGRADVSDWELTKGEDRNAIITGLVEDAKIPARLAAGDERPDGRGKYWVVTS